MSWGIIVYESIGQFYYSITMADDHFYDCLKKDLEEKPWEKFLGGKKGIPNDKIDEINPLVNKLVKRLNDKESLNLEEELRSIFKD